MFLMYVSVIALLVISLKALKIILDLKQELKEVKDEAWRLRRTIRAVCTLNNLTPPPPQD